MVHWEGPSPSRYSRDSDEGFAGNPDVPHRGGDTLILHQLTLIVGKHHSNLQLKIGVAVQQRLVGRPQPLRLELNPMACALPFVRKGRARIEANVRVVKGLGPL